jgi:hypothetical protein
VETPQAVMTVLVMKKAKQMELKRHSFKEKGRLA